MIYLTRLRSKAVYPKGHMCDRRVLQVTIAGSQTLLEHTLSKVKV